MKKITIVALLSVFVSMPALADNTGKAYIAADLGTATYSNLSPFPNPGVFRIAGGYHISPALAVELGYSKFGDSTLTGPGGSATISASSFQVAAVGSLPLSPEFDLIGKLGLSSNKAEITSTVGIFGSTSQSSLLIGFGAQFHVNSQVSVRLLYDNYGEFENGASPMKATSISLGTVFNF